MIKDLIDATIEKMPDGASGLFKTWGTMTLTSAVAKALGKCPTAAIREVCQRTDKMITIMSQEEAVAHLKEVLVLVFEGEEDGSAES